VFVGWVFVGWVFVRWVFVRWVFVRWVFVRWVFVRPDAWLGRLRGCPPCRLMADNSSLMPLRRPNQAPGQPVW
jgi:hypothetical protein